MMLKVLAAFSHTVTDETLILKGFVLVQQA